MQELKVEMVIELSFGYVQGRSAVLAKLLEELCFARADGQEVVLVELVVLLRLPQANKHGL